MTTQAVIPRDPDLRGVPAALLRAAENARRLAEQTDTPFIVRRSEEAKPETTEAGSNRTENPT